MSKLSVNNFFRRFGFPIYLVGLSVLLISSLAVVWYNLTLIENEHFALNREVKGEILLRCQDARCFEGASVAFVRDGASDSSQPKLRFLDSGDLTSISNVLQNDQHFSDFSGVLSIDLMGECDPVIENLESIGGFSFLPLSHAKPDSKECIGGPGVSRRNCKARFYRAENQQDSWQYRTKIIAWLGFSVFS